MVNHWSGSAAALTRRATSTFPGGVAFAAWDRGTAAELETTNANMPQNAAVNLGAAPDETIGFPVTPCNRMRLISNPKILLMLKQYSCQATRQAKISRLPVRRASVEIVAHRDARSERLGHGEARIRLRLQRLLRLGVEQNRIVREVVHE